MESLPKLRKYLGLSRWWFNRAVTYLCQPGTKASLSEVRQIQKVIDIPAWALECPQRIREHAMNDACVAVKNAKRMFSRTHKFQTISFRTKKDIKQSFGFDVKSLKKDFIFKDKVSRVFFHAREQEVSKIENTRVIRENSKWFLVVPVRKPVELPENQRLPIVALDPGIRTFVSYYSPEMHGQIGRDDFGRIHRLCFHLDLLISRMSKVSCKRRRKMKKAVERIRVRIRNLIDDLHRKTARFLCTRFDKILWTDFAPSRLASRLRSKTVRALLTWAHYRFFQVLTQKAELLSCEVVSTSEAYTSKTCSYCGKVHKIGSSRRMQCGCGNNTDRDDNSARGILLRALAATPSIL